MWRARTAPQVDVLRSARATSVEWPSSGWILALAGLAGRGLAELAADDSSTFKLERLGKGTPILVSHVASFD